MDLENKEWKEFFITDVAKIVSGKDIYEKERVEGKTPYISATANNNGIGHFVGNENNTIEKNCLSVNRNGSVGYSFYHPYTALFSNDCRKLRLKHPNKYIGLFISTVITKQKDKYGYGYKMGTGRLKRQKILLPINENGNPDYVFMENYMRKKETELITKYQKYISSKIKHLEKELDKEVEWKTFEVGNLFKIENCKCSKVSELEKGKVPYVGATNRNNGVLDFVNDRNDLMTKGNCIAFICDGEGSVGYSIYKAEDFIGSTTVKVGRHPRLNRYNGFFITTVADTVRSKYNFGFKRNTFHLKKERLLLPANEKGNPDFEYMENYIKRIEQEKLLNYLKYKELNIS